MKGVSQPEDRPFEFEIEDAIEVCKDPGGHYHHSTVLCGRLTSGTIKLGQFIDVPTNLGFIACEILGLDRDARSLGNSVAAESETEAFVICTGRPAVDPTIILKETAKSIGISEKNVAALNVLRSHPAVYLHHVARDRSKYPFFCLGCGMGLSPSEEIYKCLSDLVSRDDPDISPLAEILLNTLKERERLFSDQTAMSSVVDDLMKPWWKFW